MSTILVNKLTGTSTAGSILVTGEGNSTTTNLQQGLLKHWSHFDQETTPSANQDSFNSSSVADNATGDYSQNFANNMANANFVASAISKQVITDLLGSSSLTTSSIRINVRNPSFADTDADDNLLLVAGDLA